MAVVHRRDRRLVALGLVVAVLTAGAAAVLGAARLAREPVGTVTVAAVGWTYDDEASPWRRPGTPAAQVERLLAPHVREAADAGARLVVAPEVAFECDQDERQPMVDRLTALARETRATLVVGYFDTPRDENRALVITPDGTLAGEYTKTHLIWWAETYTAGDGTLLTLSDHAPPLGVMICQDDNFTDLARGYGRQRIQLLASPSNDWDLVYRFHLQSTAVRAVDSGFALVRGVSNGTSAIVDANGRILAQRDHFAEGTGAIVAELPLYPGGTTFARAGYWLPLLCAVFLVGCVVRAVTSRGFRPTAPRQGG